MLRAPILLFVANEEKYGDAYLTMWKYQFKECLKQTKSDFNVIRNGVRPEKDKDVENQPEGRFIGTWKELNARKSEIERDLKEKGQENNDLHTSQKSLSSDQEFNAALEEREKPTNYAANVRKSREAKERSR